MGTMKAALEWARRGFRVFPLKENGKRPVFKGWTETATTDPEIIREWWTSPSGESYDYNIGCCTSGLIVADLDAKSGKLGIESFESLGLEKTSLTVRTPTDGFHVYYAGPECANDYEILGPGSGLDIRGWHGFVVAPGSIIKGNKYTVEFDADIELVPENLHCLLKPPRQRGRQAGEVADDSEEALAQGLHYLLYNAPLAIEGQSGNSTTYGVCAVLTRDFGLSQDATLDMLLANWNERCTPPWDEDDLYDIVEHAVAYGTKEMGADTIESALGDMDMSFDTEVANDDEPIMGPSGAKGPRFGVRIARDVLRAIDWVYSPLLIRRQVTQMAATGAGGKSSFAMAMAIHGSLGLPFMGHKLHYGAFRSILFNAEDDMETQERRFIGICDKYGFDVDKAHEKIMLLCPDDFKVGLKLTSEGGTSINKKVVGTLIDMAKADDIALLALDPFVSLHDADENKSGQMDMVMSVLRHIAKEADTAIFLPHHTSKPGTNRIAGDVNASRGSSAIVTNARVNLMLSGMSSEEADVFGIGDDDVKNFSRLDHTKTNYAPRGGSPLWIKMHSQDVDGIGRTGEIETNSVGVPMRHNMEATMGGAAIAMACSLEAEILDHHTSTCTIVEAIAYLRVSDPLIYSMMNDKTIKLRIDAYLRRPIVTPGGAEVRIEKVGSTKMIIVQ
jgi:hypothetical protein